MESEKLYEVDKESYYKAKKYVIRIYPENIDNIEPLEPRERDQFINDAIGVYLNRSDLFKKQQKNTEKIKKIIFYSVYSLLVLALLAGIFRFLLIYSNAADGQMQQNFERLFEDYGVHSD